MYASIGFGIGLAQSWFVSTAPDKRIVWIVAQTLGVGIYGAVWYLLSPPIADLAGSPPAAFDNLPAFAVLVGGAIAGLAYGVIIALPLLNLPWHIQARPGRHLSSN